MALRDELFKLYHTIEHNANILVKCKRHPSHLRILAKATHLRADGKPPTSGDGKEAYDRIIYRHYID